MDDYYSTGTFAQLQNLRMFAHNLTEPRLSQSYLWALKKMERAAEREFDSSKHQTNYLSSRLELSRREAGKLKAQIKELETKLEGEQLSQINKQH